MVRRLPLTQGRVALIDEADFARVSAFKWYAERQKSGNWYACRKESCGPGSGRQRHVYLHRFILGLAHDDPRRVDHRDGDGLNNGRSNLRPATNSQNQANRVRCHGTERQCRGVTFHKQTGRWQAQLKHMGKNHYLGLFDSEEDAAAAYDRAAAIHFGSFARLNARSQDGRAAA